VNENFRFPEPPARPNIVTVPAWQARHLLPQGGSFGWQNTWDGLSNPKYGAYRHYVEVDVDPDGVPVRLRFDHILWDDGAIDANTGLATPGTVIFPIEKRDSEYLVRCFWQWRACIYDHVTGQQGNWVISVPGGFAAFVGETAEQVAQREAKTEAALHLLSVKIVGRASANRASVRTCVNFGYALFELDETKKLVPDEEKLVGQLAIPLHLFPLGLDGLVDLAWAFTVRDLGLVSPTAT